MLHEVLLFIIPCKLWALDRCAGADPCACIESSQQQILPLVILHTDFFFLYTCLSSSRRAFNFPQEKLHVASLFSAVCLMNTTTHFTLLFGKAHDIYVNIALLTKACKFTHKQQSFKTFQKLLLKKKNNNKTQQKMKNTLIEKLGKSTEDPARALH